MTVYKYIELGHTEVGGAITDGKKYDVLLATYRDSPTAPMSVRQTLTGKRYKSFGVPMRTFAFTLLVAATAATGYGSKSDLEGYLGATTVANNTIKYRDPFGTIWNIVIANNVQLEPKLAPTLDGTDGWYSGDFELQQTT